MERMQLKALAKINLGLDVLRKREDGYHEVRMIMQNVHIYDQILMEKQQEEGIRVKTNLYYLPANENNLVYKAARLLTDEFDLPGGLSIDLKKYTGSSRYGRRKLGRSGRAVWHEPDV